MGYVYKRGHRLWLGYFDAEGELHQVSTGLKVGQEKQAQQVLQRIEARIQAGVALGEAEQGPVTVARYAAQWTRERQVQGLSSARDEATRLRLHVLPHLGDLVLDEVRPRHVRDLVKHLRQNTTLSARSVRHVYGVVRVMFHNALADELIATSPCVLKRSDLPKLADKDPTWRAGAVFSREELEQLVSDERLPEDRRLMYALMGLAGLRFGEVSALRWRSYDPSQEPLGRLLVAASYNTDQKREKGTKTEQPRLVPVHLVLAKLLAAWKLGGWAVLMGRPPQSEDLLIPSRRGRNRSNGHGLKRFVEDLERIGLRRRRQHDLRRTFISLARTDGARKDVLERVTHGRPGGIMDLYSELPWPLLCEEVSKLRVTLPERKVLAFPGRPTAVGE